MHKTCCITASDSKLQCRVLESVYIKTAEFGLVRSSLMLTKVLTEPQGKIE